MRVGCVCVGFTGPAILIFIKNILHHIFVTPESMEYQPKSLLVKNQHESNIETRSQGPLKTAASNVHLYCYCNLKT